MNVGLFGEAKKIKLKNHFLNNTTTEPLNQNSMEFKGTKGKWYIENLHAPKEGKYPAFEIDISTETEENMCTVWYAELFAEEAKANALLISKAPEMLEMLIGFVERWDFVNPHLFYNAEIEQARQLIKEATELK